MSEETKNMLCSCRFRVTEEELALIKRDAHRHEMTVSEYLRMLIEKQRKKDLSK